MTLFYTTAKKLKDAGFPQDPVKPFAESNIYIRNKKDGRWYPGTKEPLLNLKNHGRKGEKFSWWSYEARNWDWDNYIYDPPLSELIEACGEGFRYMVKEQDEWYAKFLTDRDDNDFLMESGETPEEAVANLIIILLEEGYVFKDGVLTRD